MTFKRGDIVTIDFDDVFGPDARTRRYVVLGRESHGFEFVRGSMRFCRPPAWRVWCESWNEDCQPMVVTESKMRATGYVAEERTS